MADDDRRPLLQTTDASLDEIGGRVGYSSEYAFSKAFKREMGLAPSRYRRSTSR